MKQQIEEIIKKCKRCGLPQSEWKGRWEKPLCKVGETTYDQHTSPKEEHNPNNSPCGNSNCTICNSREKTVQCIKCGNKYANRALLTKHTRWHKKILALSHKEEIVNDWESEFDKKCKGEFNDGSELVVEVIRYKVKDFIKSVVSSTEKRVAKEIIEMIKNEQWKIIEGELTEWQKKSQ